MGSDRNPFGVDPDDAEVTEAGTRPQSEEAAEDTEGHMMLPDGTGRWMAEARERDIRKHLSSRQVERQAKGDRRHK